MYKDIGSALFPSRIGRGTISNRRNTSESNVRLVSLALGPNNIYHYHPVHTRHLMPLTYFYPVFSNART